MEMTEKIEVIVQPIKKIIIFECTKLSNEEFFQRIELLARTGQPVVLNWAEEITFLSTIFSETGGRDSLLMTYT